MKAAKLPEGWLYVPVSPKTWALISRYGDQEKTADESIHEMFSTLHSERDKVQFTNAELTHILASMHYGCPCLHRGSVHKEMKDPCDNIKRKLKSLYSKPEEIR
jgi:hypothetical protein